ncbi:MAG: UDP-N-acetylmuramoyl-tripeptide--D-alanyl-D-alanine ligase [Flavobacteriales bacterium]|nr:UDP-N-acetylmuramoyl-tripeptide--D-alanyl-D-alanine ligase [Flavobacteriales bacterium]
MIPIEKLHAAFRLSAGACTDTRQLLSGGMFFALKGPNFNANAFASNALEGGCAFAVVDDPAVVADDRFLLVPDVLKALQDLGRHHRRSFTIPVIAITGTNGKTTTKELVHAVLSADRPTLATSGNLNNHIGVPLTLLRLTHEHRIAIIEMGANKPGDIAELCAIAEPTHGLITNIGRAHLEGFGSYEGVIRTKTELYEHIRANKGTLFVNADDPLLMEKSADIARVTYGSTDKSDLHGAADASSGPFLECRFHVQSTAWSVKTRLIGAYNAPNVLAAACIGLHFDVAPERITQALNAYEPSNNRSQFMETGRNHVIMDAYNANPSSMRAALENFAAMVSDRPKLALLGGMKELGEYETQEHQSLVDVARTLGIETLLIGPEFANVDAKGIQVFPSVGEALTMLRNVPVTGRTILLKGSRGTRLETLQLAL